MENQTEEPRILQYPKKDKLAKMIESIDCLYNAVVDLELMVNKLENQMDQKLDKVLNEVKAKENKSKNIKKYQSHNNLPSEKFQTEEPRIW
ncbi:MAG: hypothetical protein KDD40_04340 [Bdellovibrionales bacterium]|nr:hypothetical protein [Bdellovibrionales bacterium]